MGKIEAVILDWSGTLVDYGCKAAEENYIEIFENYGISLTKDEIRSSMGIEKVDQIRKILESDRVSKLWYTNMGVEYNEGDVMELTRKLESNFLSKVEKYSDPKPYVKQTLQTIREMGIRIGSTTSYSTEIMEYLVPIVEKKGVSIDCWVNAQQVRGHGRPDPYMIFKNMEKMGVSSVHNVIKLGDTVSDILEGYNAGVITIGVVEGSSEIGLSETEFEILSDEDKDKLRKKVHKMFKKAGANYIINDLRSLPYIISQIINEKR